MAKKASCWLVDWMADVAVSLRIGICSLLRGDSGSHPAVRDDLSYPFK